MLASVLSPRPLFRTIFRALTADTALKRTALALFVVILASNAYFIQGTGINQNSRFDLVRAIVEQRQLTIDTYAANTFDRSFKDGHYYTDKAPGLSFAAVLPYAAVRAIGWPRPDRASTLLHVVTVLVIGTSTSAAAVGLFFTLLAMGVRRLLAALATVAWALGTNAFGYATLFYAHQFAAALLLAAFCLVRAGSDPKSARGARWLIPLAGALASWATISEYPAAVAGLMLFLYGIAILDLRRMVPFALAATVPILLLMSYNAACFDNPFTLSYTYFAEGHLKKFVDEGLFGVGLPELRPLGDILFGEMRGLLPLSPFLLLAVPGAVHMVRDPKLRSEAWVAVGMTAYFLLLTAGHLRGEAGAAMGPRYAVPLLPFAVMLAGHGFERVRRLRAPYGAASAAVCVLLVAWSIAICTMTVAVMPELADQRHLLPPSPAIAPPDMLHPLRTFVIPLFSHGYLGVKGVTPAGMLGLAYTAKGHEWDAFNLGEAMGLHGLSSLIPLGVVWTAALGIVLEVNAPRDTTKRRLVPRGYKS